MNKVSSSIAEIDELRQRVQDALAEERLVSVVRSLGSGELQEHAGELREAALRFLPKRRKRLLALLADALLRITGEHHVKPREDNAVTLDLDRLADDLSSGLADLSEHHIFQWSTSYRDLLTPVFARALSIHERLESPEPLLKMLSSTFGDHALEIFTKGYQYNTRPRFGTHGSAVSKAAAGLARFLELPIEIHSATSGGKLSQSRGLACRQVCSAILLGILEGWASVVFSHDRGWQLLSAYPRSWGHYLAFMTGKDLSVLVNGLDDDALREGLRAGVLTAVEAIDWLVTEHRDGYHALPALGQLIWDYKRLDISLPNPSYRTGGRLLEIQCFIDAANVSVPILDEAANRGVAMIVGPLRPDVREWVESHDVLRSIVVAGDTTAATSQRARDILLFAVSKEAAADSASVCLSYNFARDFPLHNPFLTKYFHVYRESVRELLTAFERRNGVRLWCSVRRSGKTTACFDLNSNLGTSVVVSQTCDSTEQRAGSGDFYQRIIAALDSGKQIAPTFFLDAVVACASLSIRGFRFVFVLDEYESLFERMALAVQRDRELRYTIVQPLLAQMVNFSRENLLVFLGQRPDAHFIIMDQNQLSPYVEQDAFPLFAMAAVKSEFQDLLRKVLTDRVPYDLSFADAVYAETAGHPFLTVKLLIELFDWLIEGKRSLKSLQLTGRDFEDFAQTRLQADRVGVSPAYMFFRQAVMEALSEEGKKYTPWLYAIYAAMRRLVQDNPESLRCSRDDFVNIVDNMKIPTDLGFSAEHLLGTGAQANFFGFSDRVVWPRIRLLARIAAVSRPRASL